MPADVPRIRSVDDLARTHRPLPGTTNVRDLAGVPGAGGTVVGPGRLLRGELLAEPDGEDALQGVFDPDRTESYDELGVRLVIDLRSERETSSTASAWPRATGAAEVRVPLREGGEGTDTGFIRQLLRGERSSFTADDLAAFYMGTVDDQAPTFAAVVGLLANGDLPALVHCAAGKDRTGLAIALTLEVLGTPRDLVVGDYALTERFRPNRVAAYAPMLRAAGQDPADSAALFGTPSAAMAATLAHVDLRYGGAEEYLVRAGGLDPRAPGRLREVLLVPGRVAAVDPP